jgi:signal transduction histidine kinase
MRKSIDNLLFLAEREAKKSPEPIVLEKEVTSVMEDLDKIYAKKKITFKITSVQDLHILADSGLVKVLLRNILENIYKYAEPNTEAKISFSKKQLIFSNISEESFSQGRIDGAFTPFVGTP